MEFLLFTAAAAGAEAATRSFSTTPDPLDVAPEPVSFQAFRKRFPPRQMPTVSPLETGTAFDYVRSAVTLVFMFVVLWTPCYVSLQILLSMYNKIVYGHAQGDPVEQQYYDTVESSAVSSEQKHQLREKRKPWGKATKTAVLVAVTALVASKQPLLWRAYAAQEFGIFYEWLRTVISPFNLYVHGASVVHYATVWMLSLPCLLCPLVPTLKKTKIQVHRFDLAKTSDSDESAQQPSRVQLKVQHFLPLKESVATNTGEQAPGVVEGLGLRWRRAVRERNFHSDPARSGPALLRHLLQDSGDLRRDFYVGGGPPKIVLLHGDRGRFPLLGALLLPHAHVLVQDGAQAAPLLPEPLRPRGGTRTPDRNDGIVNGLVETILAADLPLLMPPKGLPRLSSMNDPK